MEQSNDRTRHCALTQKVVRLKIDGTDDNYKMIKYNLYEECGLKLKTLNSVFT